jgi:hypothetical protein
VLVFNFFYLLQTRNVSLGYHLFMTAGCCCNTCYWKNTKLEETQSEAHSEKKIFSEHAYGHLIKHDYHVLVTVCDVF